MTRIEADKHKAAIEAFLRGKEIEMRGPGSVTWHPSDEPAWLHDWEYREKPEPKRVPLFAHTDLIGRVVRLKGTEGSYSQIMAASFEKVELSHVDIGWFTIDWQQLADIYEMRSPNGWVPCNREVSDE